MGILAAMLFENSTKVGATGSSGRRISRRRNSFRHPRFVQKTGQHCPEGAEIRLGHFKAKHVKNGVWRWTMAGLDRPILLVLGEKRDKAGKLAATVMDSIVTEKDMIRVWKQVSERTQANELAGNLSYVPGSQLELSPV